jgi:hypothetical protein
MRIALNIVGVILVLLGILWVLQGTNIISAGAMAGQSQWTMFGVIAIIVAIGVLWWGNRRR